MSYAYERLQELERQLDILEGVRPIKPTRKQPTIFEWADYHKVFKAWTRHYEEILDKVRQVRSMLEDDD